MPGELLAVEGVCEAVTGDLSRRVLSEGVEPFAVVRYLPASVRTLADAERAGDGGRGWSSCVDRQRLPEGEAGTGAEHAVVGLLVSGVECLSGRVHEHAARVADLLDRQSGVVA
jgi:hypothetical protein